MWLCFNATLKKYVSRVRMKKIKIRMATIDDFEDLVRLRILMQMEVNRVSRNAINKGYVGKVRRYFKKSFPAKTYFSAVAVFENRIIGAAGVCFYQKPPKCFRGNWSCWLRDECIHRKEIQKTWSRIQNVEGISEPSGRKKDRQTSSGATSDGMGIYKSVGFKKPRFVNLEYVTKTK